MVTRALVVAAAFLLCAPISEAAPQAAAPERFSALLVGTSGSPTTIVIFVERWSTAAEHDQLMTGLVELGTKGMLDVLLKLPRVASFAATGAAGYPVGYAWKTKGRDGIERITLATDRRISFGEASTRSRSLDYPITLIQLQLKPGGTGDGQLVVAAKISYDRPTRTMIVDQYDFQPARLYSVKRLK